jgi:hypothetical protein
VRARCEGGQSEQNRQADPQLEGKLAVVGDVVRALPDAGALQMTQDHEQQGRGGQYSQRAERCAAGMFGIDGQRQCHDAGGVGDGHLGQQLQHRPSTQVQRLDDR